MTQHATLLPNTTTSILIGNSSTIVGGFVYYVCKRDTNKGMGKVIVDFTDTISTPIDLSLFDDCGITDINYSVDGSDNLSLTFTVDNSSETSITLDWIFLKHNRQFTI